MTVAICTNCGGLKHGAFKPCPACGTLPVEKDELALALALTDHYFSNAELEGFGEAIRSGQSIRLPNEIKSQFERLIESSGYLESLRIAADAGILEHARGASRRTSLQVEFFDFAEEAFELGHAFMDLRQRVNKECGTFWSLFRNLFRTVNYQAFVRGAEELKGRIVELRENIDVFLEPSDDAESEFNRRLTLHVDALLDAVNLTLRKFQCMAHKAESARSGPSWEQWQQVVQDEMNVLEKCNSSGKALTRYYHQFR